MKTVCVFCSSSEEVNDVIKGAGKAFGEALGENNFAMLYGGTSCGLMKIIADGYKVRGKGLIGVVPTYMKDEGRLYDGLDEEIVVDDLGPRKQAMLDASDYIVALPGGIGTYDEFIDLLSLKTLGRHNRPMYLLNVDNYFEPLIRLLTHGVENKTIKKEALGLFKVYDDVCELVQELKNKSCE